MEWYKLPKECHSTLRLMQLRSNHPMFYQLVLGQKVDMEAYMAVSKTMKSLYYIYNTRNIYCTFVLFVQYVFDIAIVIPSIITIFTIV